MNRFNILVEATIQKKTKFTLVAINPNQGYYKSYMIWDVFGNDGTALKGLDGATLPKKNTGAARCFGGKSSDVEEELTMLGYMFSFKDELTPKDEKGNMGYRSGNEAFKSKVKSLLKSADAVVTLVSGNY